MAHVYCPWSHGPYLTAINARVDLCQIAYCDKYFSFVFYQINSLSRLVHNSSTFSGKHSGLPVDNEEYMVSWSSPSGNGEYAAKCAYSALGYAYQSRYDGAEVIEVIHNGITLSFDEFDKLFGRLLSKIKAPTV